MTTSFIKRPPKSLHYFSRKAQCFGLAFLLLPLSLAALEPSHAPVLLVAPLSGWVLQWAPSKAAAQCSCLFPCFCLCPLPGQNWVKPALPLMALSSWLPFPIQEWLWASQSHLSAVLIWELTRTNTVCWALIASNHPKSWTYIILICLCRCSKLSERSDVIHSALCIDNRIKWKVLLVPWLRNARIAGNALQKKGGSCSPI